MDSAVFLKTFGLNEISVHPNIIVVTPKRPIEVCIIKIRDIDQKLWPNNPLLTSSIDWTEEPVVFDTYSQRLSHIIGRMLVESSLQANQTDEITLTSYYLNPVEHNVDIFRRAPGRADNNYV
ncbi:hypothetical protein M1512_02405 [Patescibacteria group bacterium]|nr:hypothetical protein [Patescibacteria group bacterium]